MSLSVGGKLGPYEILGPLRAGGMGEVWKARDLRLGRIVAIKVARGNFTARFEREARAVAALNHPNVCQLCDVGSTDGVGYLVMELVDGSPIGAVDSPRKLLDLAVQIADGLTAAHAMSIVHCDLKPDNILVTREGRVKILDFGLARQSAGAQFAGDETRTLSVTEPGATVGTVNYMSPEQARERGGDNGCYHSRRSRAAARLRAGAVRWVIERLLAKEPSERYDSTWDLYRELKQVNEHLSESASAVHAVAPASGAKRGRLFATLVEE